MEGTASTDDGCCYDHPRGESTLRPGPLAEAFVACEGVSLFAIAAASARTPICRRSQQTANTHQCYNCTASCHKVFDVFELAEAIFLQLSMQDVLVNVQRTCRDWKGLIEASLPIQQALFLRPVGGERLEYLTTRGPKGRRYTKLVRPAEPPTTPTVIEHPILTDAFACAQRIGASYLGSSWARALATQPPVSELELGSSNGGLWVTPKDAGVTLGRLGLLSYDHYSDVHIEGLMACKCSSVKEKLKDLRRRMLGG